MLINPVGIKLRCQTGRRRIDLLGLVALPIMLLVGGCGFQLEGAGPLPSAMARTFVDARSRNTEFVDSLRTALRRRGTEVVESRDQADAVLSITEDETGQRVLSVSARNIPREYEIYYAVTFALQAGGNDLIEAESLVVTRSYTYDETQVLGKSSEERVLRQALADDLARQVLRRIQGIASGSATPSI